MSYPKKQDKSNQSKAPSTKLSPGKRDRLLAIQQREQLKGLIVNKFLEKYGEKDKNAEFINKEVANFIKTEKVTEDNLRHLEEKIKAHQTSKKPSQNQNENQNQSKKAKELEGNDFHDDKKSSKSVKLPLNTQSQHSQHNDDQLSIASSMKPKSVYQLGEEDDEWAMIMRFDNELYKKERELESLRTHDQKKKMMNELNKQLEEKVILKSRETNEAKLYNEVQKKQLEIMDKRTKDKESEMKQKIQHEKLSRDKQLQEEYERKKYEKKREKEIDDLLVQKIKQELDMEKQLIQQRKNDEKTHLQRVLQENEENKRKLQEFAVQEKQADINAQQEYTKLIEKQERDRENEIKKREERAKNFMAMMTDTVVKDQKQQIVEEEKKILKHYIDREEKEKTEDEKRRLKIIEEKKEMKKFLDQQVEEKKKKLQNEDELNNKQADFWKKDAENYFKNEKEKMDYIRDVNKKHAEILKKQTLESRGKKGKKTAGKMNVEELLQNKPLLKEIAEKVQNVEIKRNMIEPAALPLKH